MIFKKSYASQAAGIHCNWTVVWGNVVLSVVKSISSGIRFTWVPTLLCLLLTA